MVAWGIHWEQTISACHYFSAKFAQWGSAMRCVCIVKMGLGARRRARLPVSLCNFSPAGRPSVVLLIGHYKKNVNKKSLLGSPAALTPPPTHNSNTTGQIKRNQTGEIWLVSTIPGDTVSQNWRRERRRQLVVVSCCPHYLSWQRDCLYAAVLIGQGRVVPIRGCALIELCTLWERELCMNNVCFPSFPVTPAKEIEL